MHSIAAEALSLAMYGEGRFDYCSMTDNLLKPDGPYRGANPTDWSSFIGRYTSGGNTQTRAIRDRNMVQLFPCMMNHNSLEPYQGAKLIDRTS